ncbi:MAG TPA: 4,5-DOPA dioxygenase extradiol [Flavisolibacter sp.]
MERKQFLKSILTGAVGMTTLSAFRNFTTSLHEQDRPMPVLFIGHGSPMNGIEQNEFSNYWKQLATEIPTPKAVLVISAHWLTKGTKITAMNSPATIHDFGGFPQELFNVQYPAHGDAALALETKSLVQSTSVELDHDWGLDHGTWTIVRHMYPDANIPVLQLSIDYTKPPQYHYDLAKELAALRKKGVLIFGSGNMVHNLRMVHMPNRNVDDFSKEYGYDWAVEMNDIFKTNILNGHHRPLIEYEKLNAAAKLAIPSPDHYYPLLYTLGLQSKNDAPSIFNDKLLAGSLSMTSVKIAAA